MIRLASGGITLARRERLNSEATADINQGAAGNGKSVGMAALKRLIMAFVFADAAWMARMRSSGSFTSVARPIVTMLTWLLLDASSSARRLTGTAATRGLAGRSPFSLR